ncbi:hypothetical protein AB8S08_00465 [Pseudidiomarina sp. PP-1MA]|uniref:YD repeat-containing protein n=1 Tax=Pseudidiomarina sp. PP-1MA TaxID=3237706 RepID=A0AB39X6N7_9GAMM
MTAWLRYSARLKYCTFQLLPEICRIAVKRLRAERGWSQEQRQQKCMLSIHRAFRDLHGQLTAMTYGNGQQLTQIFSYDARGNILFFRTSPVLLAYTFLSVCKTSSGYSTLHSM